MILLLSLVLSLSAQAEGTALSGKKAAELYQAVNNTGAGQCGSGCIDISELDCNWSNTPDSRRFGCNFKDAQGKRQEVEGAKARRLVKALEAGSDVETSCGAGNCGFRESRNVKCAETAQGKKFKTQCSVSVHQESCLAAEEKTELESLKEKLSAAKEAKPGCESIRGAGGCLPPRDLITIRKLEGMEKNGCAVSRGSGHEAKPTMEAN